MSRFARWTMMTAVALVVGTIAQANAQQRDRTRQSRDGGGVVSQTGGAPENNPRYNRNASSRNAAQSAPAAAPAQPGAQAKPATGARPATTVASGKGTTGTASRLKAGNATPGGAPNAPGGAGGDYGHSGHIKEVTKAMAESLRAVRVDYDAEEMRDKPGTIILNHRRYQPESQQVQRGRRGLDL